MPIATRFVLRRVGFWVASYALVSSTLSLAACKPMPDQEAVELVTLPRSNVLVHHWRYKDVLIDRDTGRQYLLTEAGITPRIDGDITPRCLTVTSITDSDGRSHPVNMTC